MIIKEMNGGLNVYIETSVLLHCIQKATLFKDDEAIISFERYSIYEAIEKCKRVAKRKFFKDIKCKWEEIENRA